MDQSEQDQQLIDRLVAGDTTALEVLYDHYADAVFTLVLRIVADRQIAEELLQEAFVRVWQHAGTFQGSRGRVVPWLLRIAHNLAISELRRQRRRPQDARGRGGQDDEDELATISSPDREPAEEAWVHLQRAQLLLALEHLPAAQRVVIDLYTVGYSQSEIATRLGEPLGTVKTRMRLGLHKLRAILQAQGLRSERD